MGWGGSAGTRWDLDSFDRLLREVKSARSLTNGKSLECNTRAFLREGTLEEPKVIAVRLHATDILRFHSDGSTEVTNCHWVSSVTTKARLRGYGRMTVGLRKLPTFNGYKPYPERALFVQAFNTKEVYPIGVGNMNSYIRFNPDKTIDMSTVEPHTIDVVRDAKKLRKLMTKMYSLSRMLRGYAKLMDFDSGFEEGSVNTSQWFMDRLDVPLEEVQLSPFPRVYVGRSSSLKAALDAVIALNRRSIAVREGWLERKEVFRLD